MLRHGIRYHPYVRAATHLYGTAQHAYKLGDTLGRSVYKGIKGAKFLKNKYFKSNATPPGSPRLKPSPPRKVQRTSTLAARGPSYNSRSRATGPRKFRKSRRISKYKRKSKPRYNPNNGIEARQEVTQKVGDLQAVYVGHSTVASTYTFNRICECIVKAFLMKEGFHPNSVGDSMNLNIGTFFRIQYYTTPIATTPTSITSSLISANTTFTSYVDAFKVVLQTAIAAYDRRANFVRIAFYSDPAIGANYRFWHECNMNGVFISGSIRSQFNMQNATPNAVGTNETDVNNSNPLRVTKYYGKGNGTFWRNRTNTDATFQSFLADDDHGIIGVVADEVDNQVLDEPPSSKFFMHAKKGATFILQPGQIKTHTLKYDVKMSLVKYIESFQGYSEDTLVRHSIGNFAFFGCEKVLSTNLGAGTPSNVKITVDYEHDLATKLVCTMKKITAPTAPRNTSVILLNRGV